VLRKAGQCELKRCSDVVEKQDFLDAAETVKLSGGDLKKYEELGERFGEIW
jgi:hypothetical protein